MQRHAYWPVLLLLFSVGGFAVTSNFFERSPPPGNILPEQDRVVINAPILAALFAGDRYLAANLETIRLSATAFDLGMADTFYLLRAHKVVAELNPCNENNYYMANALLSWGGAVKEGGDILQRAIECRYWDELPPFLYGFNQYFFNRNIPEAQRLVRIAAERAKRNPDAYRELAVAMQLDQIDDVQMAIEILKREIKSANSEHLKRKLKMRIGRLQGLALLRDKQHEYEQHTNNKLSTPEQLLTSGLLDSFPADPMGIGYLFEDGRFILKKGKIAGMR